MAKQKQLTITAVERDLFIGLNRALCKKAYKEDSNTGTHSKKLVQEAREFFGYSDKTVNVDILVPLRKAISKKYFNGESV